MLLPRMQVVCLILCSLTVSGSKSKRSIFDLADMIAFTTGRPGLDFNKYGHFCGKGGEGQIVDNIDWCCKLHDSCYGQIQSLNRGEKKGKCHTYLMNYQWTVMNYNIVCNDEEYCRRVTCECDKRLAYCLRRFHMFYNQNFAPKSKFQNFLHQTIHFLSGKRF